MKEIEKRMNRMRLERRENEWRGMKKGERIIPNKIKKRRGFYDSHSFISFPNPKILKKKEKGGFFLELFL